MVGVRRVVGLGSKHGCRGARVGFVSACGAVFVSLAASSAVLGCSSGPTDGNSSVLGGAGKSGSSGGQPSGAGGGLNLGVGVGSVGGSAGASSSAGAAAAGAAAVTGSCPDLQTPPTNCPAKVFPDNVVIGTQADADALAGYTEIDGSLNVIRNGVSDLRNLDGLRCLQKIRFELTINRTNSLTSLDGLAELSEIGGWLVVDNTEGLKLGCGLRKLSKIGAHSPTPYVEFEGNAQLDRIELSLLGAGASSFRVDGNAALQTVVGSPGIVALSQFFIRANPLLTSVSGFDGLKTAKEVRLDTNPLLPVCQVSKIVAGLSEPPSIVETSGNLGSSCP